MKCPYCGEIDTSVLESRSTDEGDSIRRRRECQKCKKRFTTYEKLKELATWVVKKDGTREQFNKDKTRKGILRAIEKRPVPIGKVDDIVSRIENDLLENGKREVSTQEIGKIVMQELKKLDKVAWLRFASVYLEFDNLEDFEKAIEK